MSYFPLSEQRFINPRNSCHKQTQQKYRHVWHQRTIRAGPYAECIDCVGRKAHGVVAPQARCLDQGGSRHRLRQSRDGGHNVSASGPRCQDEGSCVLPLGNVSGSELIGNDPQYQVRPDFDRAYFCVGGFAGVGAGVVGCVLAGADFTPCNTELGPPCRMA